MVDNFLWIPSKSLQEFRRILIWSKNSSERYWPDLAEAKLEDEKKFILPVGGIDPEGNQIINFDVGAGKFVSQNFVNAAFSASLHQTPGFEIYASGVTSSQPTLSFDERRSEFFTKELLILLGLIDKEIIDKDILFGSWAGAFGNFQFMPRTIKDYAIDYDNNQTIELKSIEDSFASAANYLNKIGWKKNKPCYTKIELNKDIPKKYLNSSARKIKNKRKAKFFKKYIKNSNKLNINDNLLSAIITPDKDIIPGSNTYTPAYLVYGNYEKILSWNRSLRFALAVCTLKNNFKNEI